MLFLPLAAWLPILVAAGGGTTLGSGGVRCTVGGAVIGRNGGGNITLGDGATLGVGGFMLSDDVVLWCWGRG